MNANLLLPVYLKIDRAKKHIAELSTEIGAFNTSKPYALFREDDPKTGDQLTRVKIHRHIPDRWSAIVGDAIHNMRASLDVLAVALVKANGVTSKTGINETYFPISASKTAFFSQGIRKIRRASPDAIRIIERMKPYRGGTEAFWFLHQFDILDKHEAIIPVAGAQTKLVLAYEMITPGGQPVQFPPFALNPANIVYPLKDGDVVMRTAAAARASSIAPHKDNVSLIFEVAFGEGQIIDGQPVAPSLQQLIDFTERIIDIFARRIFKTA